MKKVVTNSFDFIKKHTATIILLIGASFYLLSQSNGVRFGSDRDVIPGYKGWAGDPDTITIHIDDSSYSDAEKDSIRTAINRWNDAGCVPKIKEVDDPPANVTVVESDTLSDGIAGMYKWSEDGNGDVTGGTIYINDDTSPLSLKEVVTHELGHAIGLDDVTAATNPTDVMKGSDTTNGSDGNLSAHDSTELAAASAAAVAVETDTKIAMNPMAILPGEFAMLDFDLGQAFPPDVIDQTGIFVSPIGDPYLFVETAFIEENLLKVGVFSDPMHGSGRLYLSVELLFPEPYEPMNFWGTHFIHLFPAEPVTFECPFTFNEDDGLVHIDWVEHCTYPLEHPLRAELVVDGTTHYQQRGGGNYTLFLAPGTHFIELFVDDYQVNNAYYAMDILVTGVQDAEEKKLSYKVYPNPFTDYCQLTYPGEMQIKIFDISGKLVNHLQKGEKVWKPSAELPYGIYFIQFIDGNTINTRKIIYGK